MKCFFFCIGIYGEKVFNLLRELKFFDYHLFFSFLYQFICVLVFCVDRTNEDLFLHSLINVKKKIVEAFYLP